MDTPTLTYRPPAAHRDKVARHSKATEAMQGRQPLRNPKKDVGDIQPYSKRVKVRNKLRQPCNKEAKGK